MIYDLIGITKTWWDGSEDWNIGMQWYRLFRKDWQRRQGGDAMLYGSDHLECMELSLPGDRWEVDQDTPSSVMQCTCWREGMTSRRVLTDWRAGPTWILPSWTRPSVEGPASKPDQSQEKTGRAEIKTSCGKKDLVGVVDEKLNLTWQWEIIAQKAYHILDCSERRDQQVEGGDFSPLLLWEPTWCVASNSGLKAG